MQLVSRAYSSMGNVAHSGSEDLNVACTKLHTVTHIYRQKNGTVLALFLGRNRTLNVAHGVSV